MYEIDYAKFGAFISQLRREKGITQKELAERLFVSDKAVSKWERGLSLPDIALLQPLADLFEVTITELLSGQYIRKDQPLLVEDVDPLLAMALEMTAQEKERQAVHRRQWGRIFIGCFAALAVELLLLRAAFPLWDAFASVLYLPPLMAAIFGVYFVFFAKEKLPPFYDQYKIYFYSDGCFRMNIPGVCFNNRNWSHILNTLRTWSCVTIAAWVPCYALLRWMLSPLPELAGAMVMLAACFAATLGGIFIPVAVVGRKYQ